MAFISVFEVIGPNMVGPSSSHTAGAASIANLARKLMHEKIKKVTFVLYGSFAQTYRGHGTDRALLGGMMGFETDDIRIRDSFEIAEKEGLEFSFEANTVETDVHPNTVDMIIEDVSGRVHTVRGESIGGGKVRLTRIDGVKVHFTGEYHSLIVEHKDHPGVIAYVTTVLSKCKVNIAYLRVYRETKGGVAYMIIESDEEITKATVDEIEKNPFVKDTMLIKRK
ncbi:MAG: L-serine ammonia-lyase, iron-sulfur-dependent subunit beta [Clostridia bacterium]|nr:L-serine ammonia-lyase, iron-sulfur-dependent subunit beta [Clostridia bacterium]